MIRFDIEVHLKWRYFSFTNYVENLFFPGILNRNVIHKYILGSCIIVLRLLVSWIFLVKSHTYDCEIKGLQEYPSNT